MDHASFQFDVGICCLDLVLLILLLLIEMMKIISVLSLILTPSLSLTLVLPCCYSINSNIINNKYNRLYCTSSSFSSSSSFGSSNSNSNEYQKKVTNLPRIYLPSSIELNHYNDLDHDTSHYLGTVLRLRDGDMLRVFNSNNGEYLCEIIDTEKDKKRRKSSSLRIHIKEQLRTSLLSNSLPNVVLYMAPIKKQRMKL
jgi:hypothetical protein